MDDLIQHLRKGAKRIITHFSCSDTAYDGSVFTSSAHPSREFVFSLSGSCDMMLDRKIFHFEPGDVMLFDSWDEHGFYYTVNDKNLVHLWGYLEKEHLRGSMVKIEDGKITSYDRLRFIYSTEIKHLLERRWERFSAIKEADEEKVREEMAAIINLVLDETALAIVAPSDEYYKNTLSEKISSYIRSCNGRQCSLERLGNIFAYSKYHLAHCFLKETGISIGKFIEQVRIDYTIAAKRRGLRNKEIADELGFSSPSAFSNWWKKHH